MPGPEHASELMTWGAVALAVIPVFAGVLWMVITAAAKAHARRLGEIVEDIGRSIKDLSSKFDQIVDRLSRQDLRLALNERDTQQNAGRLSALEDEVKRGRDRYHLLVNQVTAIRLRLGMREIEVEKTGEP